MSRLSANPADEEMLKFKFQARAPYSHELFAMAKHIAVRLHTERKAALDCKAKHDFPEDCKPESEALLRSTNKLFEDILTAAPKEFKEYSECLDFWGFRYHRCKDKMEAFEKAFPIDPSTAGKK